MPISLAAAVVASTSVERRVSVEWVAEPMGFPDLTVSSTPWRTPAVAAAVADTKPLTAVTWTQVAAVARGVPASLSCSTSSQRILHARR